MNKIKFFVKFVIFLTILFLAWIPFAETFDAIRNVVAASLFNLITGSKLNTPASNYISGAMTNIISFTALVLATPKIILNRRIKVIVFGVIVLFFLEVFTIDIFLFLKGGAIGRVIVIFMHIAGNIFFPVALWILMLHREIFPKKAE